MVEVHSEKMILFLLLLQVHVDGGLEPYENRLLYPTVFIKNIKIVITI